MTATGLYRMFDGNGRLLYVGISEKLGTRFAGHARKTSWFGDVARIEIERHPTRPLAAAAESQAIRNEHPLYNVAQTSAAKPERRAPRHRAVTRLQHGAAISPIASPKYQLIEMILASRLGMTFPDYVAVLRSKQMSWSKVATQIHNATGEHISQPTLIGWFAKSEVGAA